MVTMDLEAMAESANSAIDAGLTKGTDMGQTLSPEEVRKILRTDNREIVKLCKKASIIPKKNEQGQTYFSYDEVQNLQKLQTKRAAVSCDVEATSIAQSNPQTAVSNLLTKLETLENNLSNTLSKVIDEKLDGMDEVVVELIRCKTENESLRQKINELNKENYHIKSSLKSYKAVGLGLYVKKSQDDFSI